MKVQIYKNPTKEQVEIRLTSKHGGHAYACEPCVLKFSEVEEGCEIPPSFVFNNHSGPLLAERFLQAFGAAIIDAGYVKAPDSEKEIQALKNHLKDLQKIIFKEKTFKDELREL